MARSLYGAYLFLVGWVFYYKAAVDGGAIIGLTRLSFPGSDSFLSSDAHLYSSYLSTMLLGYIFFLGKEFRHSFWKVAVILVLSIAALLLTGSRNGLLGVGVGLLVYFFLLLSGSVAIKLQNFLRIIAVCVFVMVIIYMSWAEFVTYADELLIRATSFDGLQDESGLGRIAKAGVAVEEVLDSNVFFGLGVFSASLIWYDGALSIAFAHFGLLGGVTVLGIVVFCFRYIQFRVPASTPSGRAIFSILVAYIFMSFITEFALVTRSILPTIGLIGTIIARATVSKREYIG